MKQFERDKSAANQVSPSNPSALDIRDNQVEEQLRNQLIKLRELTTLRLEDLEFKVRV